MVWDPFPSQLRPFWQRCFSVQVTLTNLSTSTITGLGRLWSSWMGASTSAVLSGNIKNCVVDSTPNSEKEPLLTDFARKKQPPIWPFPRWCWGLGWASSSIASGASSCAAETNHFSWVIFRVWLICPSLTVWVLILPGFKLALFLSFTLLNIFSFSVRGYRTYHRKRHLGPWRGKAKEGWWQGPW